MDSLLANYASSDEEDDQKPHHLPPPPFSSSLPKPKPSPFFNSLPPPKHEPQDKLDSKPTSRSLLFSSLPKPKLEDIKPPKSQIPNKPISTSKRVVQFKPPIFANPTHLDDDDDEKEEEQRRRRKASEASSAQPLSVTSFLSAIPAPRNSASLGVGSSGLGSGRRAIVETESVKAESDAGLDRSENVGVYDGSESSFDPNAASYEGGYGGGGGYASYEGRYGGVEHNVDSGVQLQAGVSGSDALGYGGYGGNHGNEWADVSRAAVMGVSGGKRRRNDIPIEILEVKQDELMKNRPREDQAKATGIAFGPSYQPVSAKGKPTKLHKRKHQIGSLYFDMKQKEMELQERRSKGFLTKAETQAKYGW
ncbi:uncharacterized protein LOC126791143 [Argentina anserina]|uniref:uncharacterized protein LOC126791143 n=1 Tax=Argentina anserina TaxID=57926 RepID=UPI0021763422|nr:uncharacterized protein LOC126791143 [Potentilla anserina]